MEDSRSLFKKEYCLWRNWNMGAMESYVDTELHMGYPVALYRMEGTTVVAVAPDITEATDYVKTLSSKITFSDLMDDLFEHVRLVPDLAYFTLLRRAAFMPVACKEGWQIRRLEKKDAPALKALLSTCTKKEREQGAVSVEDPLCMGLWEGDTLLSAASFWYWGNVLADVGVVTRTDRRKEGAAAMVVSALCEKGLANGRLPLYRYESTNEPSGAVSRKLGFTQVALLEGAQVFYEE